MTAEEAMFLADVLDQLQTTIWKTFGDGMADYLGRVDPDGMPYQDPPSWAQKLDESDD
jgi:hypothetical protein